MHVSYFKFLSPYRGPDWDIYVVLGRLLLLVEDLVENEHFSCYCHGLIRAETWRSRII